MFLDEAKQSESVTCQAVLRGIWKDVLEADVAVAPGYVCVGG